MPSVDFVRNPSRKQLNEFSKDGLLDIVKHDEMDIIGPAGYNGN